MSSVAIFGLLILVSGCVAQDQYGRCYHGAQDIVFVLDSSGSVGPANWKIMTVFIADLVQELDVGENRTRIGVVTFHSRAWNSFYLNSHKTKEATLDAVRALPYVEGGTNIPSGLRLMAYEQFTEENGDRPDSPNIGILITDALTEGNEDPVLLQNLKESKLRMFAVGIGSINEANLAELGYSGYWATASFITLQSIKSNLTVIECLEEVDKSDCKASCAEDQPGCYREGSVQVCQCSYDWVSKYCFPEDLPTPPDNIIPGQGNEGEEWEDIEPDRGQTGAGNPEDRTRQRLNKDGCLFIKNPTLLDSPNPQINMVCPTYGPESGGTDVFIWGKQFATMSDAKRKKRDTRPEVLIGGQPCEILFSNFTFIHCLTGQCEPSDRAMDIDLNNNDLLTTVPEAFRCMKDPIITDVYPSQTILAGGNKVTVEGKALNSVYRAIMEVTMVHNTKNGTTNTLFTSTCDINSSIMMTCPYPAISLPEGFSLDKRRKRETSDPNRDLIVNARIGSSGIKKLMKKLRSKRDSHEDEYVNKENVLEFYLGFKLDGVTTYTNISKVLDGKGVVFVYKDPVIKNFPDKDRTREHKKNANLVIQGENLDFGCGSLCGYVITIGSAMCEIKDMTMNEIQCKAPEMDKNEDFDVKVSVGNLEFSPGFLRYRKPPPSAPHVYGWQSILLFICCGMIVLVVILVWIFLSLYTSQRRQEVKHFRKVQEKDAWRNGRIDPHIAIHTQVDGELGAKLSSIVKDPSIVQIGTTIHKGKFGVVYSAWLFPDDTSVHVTAKATLKTNPTVAGMSRFLDDCLMLQSLNHKNVLAVHGAVMIRDRLHILIARGEYGGLNEYITRKLGRTMRLKICLDVALGMEYLSDKGILHKDLAARNCVITEYHDTLIGDRGLADDRYPGDYVRLTHLNRPLAVRWAALEVLDKGNYSQMSDVWSFGVLMWEVFTKGMRPYKDIPKLRLRQQLYYGTRLEKPRKTSSECYSLMMSCWNPFPPNRPSFQKLAVILNSMCMDSNRARAEPILQDDGVYIGRATAYSSTGFASGFTKTGHYPTQEKKMPPPPHMMGIDEMELGRYDSSGKYLIDVESDEDEELPVYAEVKKGPRNLISEVHEEEEDPHGSDGSLGKAGNDDTPRNEPSSDNPGYIEAW